MHALLMYVCPCDRYTLIVGEAFKHSSFHAGQHEEKSLMIFLGVYPTKVIADKVRDRLMELHARGPGEIVDYMRKHTPPVRMSRREAKRTRATIAAALEIIDDEAERRKLMPF